jgi:hypothetical protein
MCLYKSSAALIRGYSTGEIYFGSTWYWVAIGDRYNAIFYSNDRGQSLEIVYVCDIDAGDMQPYSLMRDATPGVFYNIQPTNLWMSQNYCSSWALILPSVTYTSYSAGITPGEIYAIWTNEALWRVELWKSMDYGNNFQLANESVSGKCEVGTEPGEIYHYHLWYEDSIYLKINLSQDGGASFNTSFNHDTSICGLSLMGHKPIIYHGANPGELYLVSWFPPAIFKIFHSTDYGYSFEHRFTSSFCDFFYEGYGFTPGVGSGEFYYSKKLPWFDGINTKIHIYHSSDTAKTFTEYVHVLDSNFPVNIYEEKLIEHKNIEIINYPNPFTYKTNIRFNSDRPGIYTIELTNLSGQAVLRKEEYLTAGQQEIELNTNDFQPGVYLCSVKSVGRLIGVRKIVKR